MRDRHIMLDLETLDKRPSAVIVAIGAVLFDRDGVHGEFYAGVDIDSCLDLGMTVSGDTILWWLEQAQAAREALYAPAKTPCHLHFVLEDFRVWAGTGSLVWGNGAAFDNVILEAAYRRTLRPPPWDFWNNRCYRTVRNAYPSVARHTPAIAHHALYDAHAQATHLIEIQQSYPEAQIL